VQHKAKRHTVEWEGIVRNTPERQKKSRSIGFASVLSPRNTAHSFTQQDEVFVLTRSVKATTVMTATNSVSAMYVWTTAKAPVVYANTSHCSIHS